jgi:hypothetical protein
MFNLKPITESMKMQYDAAPFKNGDRALHGTANGFELVIGGESGELYGPWLDNDLSPDEPVLVFETDHIESADDAKKYCIAFAECVLAFNFSEAIKNMEKENVQLD